MFASPFCPAWTAYRGRTVRDDDMTRVSEQYDLAALGDQLSDANAVTPGLIAEVIDLACRRFPSRGQSAKAARVERLICTRAWTDVALALIEIELPLWHIRRIAYDAGEWYCTLSRQWELPDWLDESVEGRHADLASAILSAFVNTQIATLPSSRPRFRACLAR
jgi:hypothetical protein